MKKLFIFSVLSAFSAVSALPVSAAAPTYEVMQPLALGEATKWDYTAIDATRSRLFVTRGDRVDVVDLVNHKLIGSIPDTQGVHGVAFAQDLKVGFTSNGKSDSVTVFDLDTLKRIQDIKLTGSNPDAILYDALSHKVFIFNGHSGNVDIVDAKSMKVVSTVKATGRPEFAVSDGRGKIYFNIEDNAGINVIDAKSDTVVSTWKLAGCDEPTGLAIDAANSRLISACRNGIAVVTDAKTGKRVTQFPIGEHPDAVIYDADTHTVLTSNGGGAGTLTVVHQDDADHYRVLENVATEKAAKTMAMDTKTKTVYLPTVVDNKFVVIMVAKKASL